MLQAAQARRQQVPVRLSGVIRPRVLLDGAPPAARSGTSARRSRSLPGAAWQEEWGDEGGETLPVYSQGANLLRGCVSLMRVASPQLYTNSGFVLQDLSGISDCDRQQVWR